MSLLHPHLNSTEAYRGVKESVSHLGSARLASRARAVAGSGAVVASVDAGAWSRSTRRVSVPATCGWKVTILTTSSMMPKTGSMTNLPCHTIDAAIEADRRKWAVSGSFA